MSRQAPVLHLYLFAHFCNSSLRAVVRHLLCHRHLRHTFRRFASYHVAVHSLAPLCFYILYLPLHLSTSAGFPAEIGP